jgi:nucleoside-diphosphate-sugar epimerase
MDDVPAENQHVPQDKIIVEAGTRKENPIRTMIIFPSWIFGVGEAIQKNPTAVRIYTDMFLKLGYAGTWGEGHSRLGNIHVKDAAEAIMVVLKAALKGEADEGADGLCECRIS